MSSQLDLEARRPLHPLARVDALWGCDSKSIQQNLEDKSSDLFATTTDKVECWTTPTDNDSSKTDYVEKHILGDQDLELSADRTQQARDVFFVVHQVHSWDRLHVTKHTWKKLTARHNVFPYFSETVLAFGLRTEYANNTWDNFHSRTTGLSGDVETCYTVRFFERNDRNTATSDPWSPRQTGIYHRLHAETQTSVWILIKPSPRFKDALPEKLRALSHHEELRGLQHIFIHLMVLAFSLHGWRDYIATQWTKIEEFEGKSFFSGADEVKQNDYTLSFEDRQRLQRLRQKLIKAASMLDAATNLAQRIRSTVPIMNKQLTDEVKHIITTELDDFNAEVKYYKRCITELLQRSSEAANLLLSILEHRIGNLHLRSAIANESSQKASELAQRASAQSLNFMSGIAINDEMEHKLEEGISTNVRALTVVATLYLPASLLAGIWSSQLVSSNSGHFAASREFWKYIVILIPMTAATFAVVFALQAVWTRRHDNQRKALEKVATERGLPESPLSDF